MTPVFADCKLQLFLLFFGGSNHHFSRMGFAFSDLRHGVRATSKQQLGYLGQAFGSFSRIKYLNMLESSAFDSDF